MNRRRFLLAGALGVFAPTHAFGQSKPVTIGMLGPRAKSYFDPDIRRRLAELGYREGPKVRIEYRHADGIVERFPQLARDLDKLGCDLIFAIGPEHSPRALLDARVAAPIVFLAIDYDPLEKKIVESLARPGRNITGVYARVADIAVKRLEITREMLPSAKRFLVLSDAFSRDQLPIVRKAAASRGVQISVVEFSRRPYDYGEAFAAARRDKAEALLVLNSPMFSDDRAALAELALANRLPSISFLSPENYSLIGYGANTRRLSYRAAEIGVQILRGAKAGEIPVHQADEFEVVVNLKIAKALNLKVPQAVIARATNLIE